MDYYPPKLSGADLERLVLAARDWSASNGLLIRPPPGVDSSSGSLAAGAPVTLFPSAFPETCFEQAQEVQVAYNELYAKVAQDEPFIEEIVKDVAEGDDFTKGLWAIHERVKDEGYTHKLSLGLFRSDYMVHKEASSPPEIKQVEFNTIAASFGGLSGKTSGLHQFLSQTQYPLLPIPPPVAPSSLPPNGAVSSLAAGLAAAHRAYVSGTPHPLCILFVVQAGERNIFDQRHVEHELVIRHRIPVFRLNFGHVLSQTRLEAGSTRELLYRLPSEGPSERLFEVSTVYLRAGYGPGDYPVDGSGWTVRHHLERSAATKCPSILTQLAGAKKVQQVLAQPEMLRKFAQDEESAKIISRTFADLYPLDESDRGLAARAIALDSTKCLDYVLKPQREGGGNNIYRGAIPGFMATLPKSHWKSYILMKLITPPPARNFILRDGRADEGGVIGELGVYGTCLWRVKGGEILRNEEAGYLLRTKGDKSEEGGVAAGFGCMDSVLLV